MRTVIRIGAVTVFMLAGYLVFASRPKTDDPPTSFPAGRPAPAKSESAMTLATFGSGCFWCTEAVFQMRKGVTKVVSGYAGGHVVNPTYEQICGGRTGHAEVIQVTFDPAVVSYEELLELFWRSHDPTTKDRQGNDVGPQYRSVIFVHDETQKSAAESYKRKIDEAKVFDAPVVTEVVAYSTFYPAEAYHQNYFRTNPNQPYCRALIGPKVEKLKKVFGDVLHDPAK
jgi:peptide-methionine (S)-S-oxide reductase